MARKKQNYINGVFRHRRTEADYMATLLDAVGLDDWRGIVTAAVDAAKAGDAGARAWLAQYLVGRPATTAPTPLLTVVQQLSGNDPLVEKLAHPHVERVIYPSRHFDDDLKEGLKAKIAAELYALETRSSMGSSPPETIPHSSALPGSSGEPG